MHKYFKVGDKIGNYCNGFFGRDDYHKKKCVMVTEKYAVFEYLDGHATVLNLRDPVLELTLSGTMENWKYEDGDDILGEE